MMISSLVELAKQRGLLANPDTEERRIDFVVVIDGIGRFLRLISRRDEKNRGALICVPRGPKRAGSTCIPAFVSDNAKYVLGLGEPGKDKPGRISRCNAAFIALSGEAEERTHDAGLGALVLFYKNYEDNLAAILAQRPREEWNGGENLIFQLAGDEMFLHDRPLIRDYWAAQRAAEGQSKPLGALVRCLATGALTSPVRLHPSIKGLVPYGGKSSGASLVSFNAKAFESYGLEQGDNAPMSRAAAEAYTTALNWMLEQDPTTKRRHRYGVPLGDDAVAVFWVNGDNNAMDDVAAFFSTPSDADQAVRATESAWQGIERSIDSSKFFALTLGGNASRAVVRDWYATTMGSLKQSLRGYFNDLALANGDDREGKHPLPIGVLIKALDPPGGASLPPDLGAQLFRASLDEGAVFPTAILRWALMRLRVSAEGDRRDRKGPEQMLHARCSLIKASLRRLARRPGNDELRKQQMEITMALDESNNNSSYVLGRLFAVLERLQGAAQGDLNATIRDRYFGAASSTPSSVFGRLLELSTKHLAKLAGGLEHYFDERLRVVMRKLDGSHIPAHHSLEEQGLFAIGYFHERDWLIEDGKKRHADKQQTAAAVSQA